MGTGGKCGTSLTGSVKVGVENTLVAFKGAGGRVYGLEKNELNGVLLELVVERMRCGT